MYETVKRQVPVAGYMLYRDFERGKLWIELKALHEWSLFVSLLKLTHPPGKEKFTKYRK